MVSGGFLQAGAVSRADRPAAAFPHRNARCLRCGLPQIIVQEGAAGARHQGGCPAQCHADLVSCAIARCELCTTRAGTSHCHCPTQTHALPAWWTQSAHQERATGPVITAGGPAQLDNYGNGHGRNRSDSLPGTKPPRRGHRQGTAQQTTSEALAAFCPRFCRGEVSPAAGDGGCAVGAGDPPVHEVGHVLLEHGEEEAGLQRLGDGLVEQALGLLHGFGGAAIG